MEQEKVEALVITKLDEVACKYAYPLAYNSNSKAQM